MPLSAVECVQPALQHTRAQLFTNFRWGQWSRLALVGILAAELHVGGCGVPNFGSGRWLKIPNKSGHISQTSALFAGRSPLDMLPRTPGQISQHLAQFVGLIVVGIFVVMLLSFLFLYLNSVFRFILFDSVLRRECSISDGWKKWRVAGGRFLLWQIVFQISTWIFFVILVGVPVAFALAAGWATDFRAHIGRVIIGVIFGLGLLILFALTIAVVQTLAKDFLVPIMALEGLDFADGWRHLLAIVRRDQGRFAVYLLLKLVLLIAAGIIFTIAAIIPVLLAAIPAIIVAIGARTSGVGWNVNTISLTIIFGSVLFAAMIYLIALVCVPATVFFPAYALYFFAARYPNLEMLLNPVPAPPQPVPPVPQSPPPLPPTPQSSPPFEAPPLPPSAEPIG